jgi:group II intron reverse transcriptase/maturase
VPKPAKFEEVRKPDGTMRPLAISCFEDKIVQSALKELLEVLYEPIFVDDSHGFRPGRGCDTALVDLRLDLMSKDCGALIDIDLKAFFNSIPHDILIKFLEMKIKQPDLIYLILKIMRTPIQNKDGSATANTIGVPQGSVVSPVLANVFLHYVLDIWFHGLRSSGAFGVCNMVRYADDAIFTFEDQGTADRFMEMLQARLKEFGIELNVGKTTKTPYGRKYAASCKVAGRKTPIFRFLGFLHYWKESLNRSTGKTFLRAAVKSCPKRMRKKLQQVVEHIKKHRHDENLVERTGQVVRGIAAYFCVNDNLPSVSKFSNEVRRALFKWLNRRSQQRGTWEELMLYIYTQGYPERFKVKNLFFNMKGV